MKRYIFLCVILTFLGAACGHTTIEASLQEEATLPTTNALPTPARTSRATATATVILSPPPTSEVVQPKIECTSGGELTTCYDNLLGIEFQYPTTWGTITTQGARLSGGRDSRYASGATYQYSFAEPNPQALFAGGRSKDFVAPRGGFITDFRGFGKHTVEEVCDSFDASICQEIQPNVVFMVALPKADYICEPGPGVIYAPIGLVAINLPEGQLVNGFVIGSKNILAPEFLDELDSIIGLTADSHIKNCDGTSRQQFDAKIKVLFENIQASSLDNETAKNVSQLIRFAESIKFR